MNSCLYYDVPDESCARLNAMIETMNEQHTHFVNEMWEFGLLHETVPSLLSSRLEASLFDDCESSFPLEFDFIHDTHLTNLKEEFGPPVTSSPLVAYPFLAHLLILSLATWLYLILPSL